MLGRFPQWLAPACRRYLTSHHGGYQRGVTAEAIALHTFNLEPFRGLFDHTGRRGRGKAQTLITMPYGDFRGEAQAFADGLGLELVSEPGEPRAWHPNTYLFEFSKP